MIYEKWSWNNELIQGDGNGIEMVKIYSHVC